MAGASHGSAREFAPIQWEISGLRQRNRRHRAGLENEGVMSALDIILCPKTEGDCDE
jgi:hypothetical protein